MALRCFLFASFWLAGAGLFWLPPAANDEISGYLEAEARLFPQSPIYPQQRDNNASLAASPEYYHEFENGSSFVCVLFGRLDSADTHRTHADIRELNFLYLADNWELTVGIDRVFWGVTEFYHLADIINQTDLVEELSAEEKLGQPMVHLSVPADWGVVDLFVMPWFRETTFPGWHGRLRFGIPVNTDETIYESAAGQHHVDVAARYSHTIGDVDFGIYQFYGTGREPSLVPGMTSQGGPELRPFYQIISQTGLDAQLVAGQWLFKLESIYRSGQGDGYFSGTGGFEYTLVAVAGTAMDVGILAEYAYDERGNRSGTYYQNDFLLGMRLAANDATGSELLLGAGYDFENRTKLISVEGGRRLNDHLKLTVKSAFFIDVGENDILYDLRRDSFVRLILRYYF